MSETYSRLDLELDLRLAEAESVGVGFDVPAPNAPKFIAQQELDVAA
jgi:hypothetical protein